MALWLTRGRSKTFPLLQLDGEAIGDSTAIIAELEAPIPRPTRSIPRIPTSAVGHWSWRSSSTRSLGPHARLLAFHEATKDPAVVERFTVDLLPGRARRIGPVRAGAMRFFTVAALATG